MGEILKTYDIPEVSKMLGLSVETIRKYLRTGKLKGSKLGKSWKITEEEVREFYEINSNKHMTKG